MFLTGNLKGVLVPPPLYGEFGWAYLEQNEYLRQHPAGALTDAPLSIQVGLDLQAELSRNIDEGVMAFYGLSRLSRQDNEIARPSGVGIEPADVLHFIECFRRQSFLLECDAIEYAGTIAGDRAGVLARGKMRLAETLHTTCMASELQRQELVFEYTNGRRPIRPPVTLHPGKGTWHFRSQLSA